LLSGVAFYFESINASVSDMKLDSTPFPDFADASKTDNPVLFVNS
jgi:hypothetical protein